MMVSGYAEQQVTPALPPTKGQFLGWKWRTFYNAILHVMQNPASQSAYFAAYRAIATLPANMRFTPQVLTAAWARFTRLFPGWKDSDYRSAYETMRSFLSQTGRILEGDGRQWWTVEREWQDMEAPTYTLVRTGVPSMSYYAQ